MDLKNRILGIMDLPTKEQDAALDNLLGIYSKEDLKSSFSGIVDDYNKEVIAIKNNVIKEHLDKISPIISFSYIAKNYFKKSKGWLSLKIKGGTFSELELEILNSAIQDISVKIADCKIKR